MATRKYLANIDLNQNELQNSVIQNLAAAPANPKDGQIYFNTTDKAYYGYKNSSWVKLDAQGTTYTAGNGIDSSALANGTIQTDTTIASKTDIGDGTLTIQRNGSAVGSFKANATNATTINISVPTTATEVGALPDTTVIGDGKTIFKKNGTAFATITANQTGTVNVNYTIPTTASDVGALPDSTVIGDASFVIQSNGTAVGTIGVNATTGSTINVTSTKLSDISIASGSTNYLTYNSSNGQIGAKVDGSVTAASTNLITSGAVDTAISNAIVGGVKYIGTWTATGQTDYSSITLPVKKGYLYLVEGSATIGGIEWNAGDYLMVNADVASGGTLTNVSKIDNTEGTDIVRLNATQTLTNKTIDADNNTIQDLTTSNLKSGVLQTTVRATTSASNTSLASELAISKALAGKQDTLTAGSNISISGGTISATDTTYSAGSGIASATLANGTIAVDFTAVATAAQGAKADTAVQVYSASNPALTASGGQCTWTVTHNLGTRNVQVKVYEISTWEEVVTSVALTSTSVVTVKLNSTSNISAATYQVVVAGH
jgi:hypothetical protein